MKISIINKRKSILSPLSLGEGLGVRLLFLLLPCSVSAQQTFNELTYTKDASSFRLNAPSKAKSVKIHIYKEGVGGEKVQTVKMKRTGNDLWTADIKGDLKGKFYTFQVETKGKWKNVVIEKAYLNALNSPSYDRIKLLFKRSVAGMNKIANGDRAQLDFETAKVLMTDNLELFLKTQNFILEQLKSVGTPFAKKLVADTKAKEVEQQYQAWQVINSLARQSLQEVSKDYRIINDGEELKVSKNI